MMRQSYLWPRVAALAVLMTFHALAMCAPAVLSEKSQKELSAVVKLFANSYILGMGESHFVTSMEATSTNDAIAVVGSFDGERRPNAYTVFFEKVKGKVEGREVQICISPNRKKGIAGAVTPFPVCELAEWCSLALTGLRCFQSTEVRSHATSMGSREDLMTMLFGSAVFLPQVFRHTVRSIPGMRRALIAAVVSLVCLVSGAAACEGAALGAKDYDRAVKKVFELPETQAWRRSHPYPVAIVPGTDKQQDLGATCYWSVAVYANRPERLELWHVFFVEVAGVRILISDIDGNEVPLAQWRETQR